MARPTPAVKRFSPQTSQLIFILALVFFFSGFAALIYNVVWQRLLTLYYGVGTISITLIVSVYMAGLGLGAFAGGFLAERVNDKIKLYFVTELLIGLFGLVSLPFLDFLGKHTAGSSYILSFFYMFLFLCLPTFLMGMTLPIITKIFNSLTDNFLDTVSFLYFVNTIGAALGALFAAYVAISYWGLDTAVYIAVVINLALAGLIYWAGSILPSAEKRAQVSDARADGKDNLPVEAAYRLVFVTGFLAIGYEIVWFRFISVLVKASAYSFASILSVYLFGIALGSLAMSLFLKARSGTDKVKLFFAIQFGIGLYVALSFIGYYYLTQHTGFAALTKISFDFNQHPPPNYPIFHGQMPFFNYAVWVGYLALDVFIWPFIFVFIPTVLMGASFPLISLLAFTRRDRDGETIGTLYFFNILGNVLGGVVTGFVLLTCGGTELTLMLFVAAGLLFGVFMARPVAGGFPPLAKIWWIFVLLLAVLVVFPKKGQLYAVAHIPHLSEAQVFQEEGRDGVIMTYQEGEHVENYINGMAHGGRPGYMFYYETIEAVSFAPSVENILIIGYGTGSILEAVLKLEDVKKITLVELNHTLMKNLLKMDVFKDMLADPRVELIYDDGRRFLLRTPEKFDLILMDPIRTTTAYSNNIYSKEFFALADKHLKDNGILMVWMDEYMVMLNTILSAFDHIRMYGRPDDPSHYGFCLASAGPFGDYVGERRSRIANAFSLEDQKNILDSAMPFLGNETDIRSAIARYPVNRDWKPVNEYYLGKSFRLKQSPQK